MYEYDDVLSAAKGLLAEVIRIVDSTNLEYAIVGGWSPYLRNDSTHSGLIHPGTKDVDVLFLEGCKKSSLEGAVKAFLDRDYMVSAKHDFQLFRSLCVGGHELVFNIDFLHPLEGKANSEIFVDHFDLGIPESKLYQEIKQKKSKSIALEYSKYIFDGFVKPFNVTTVMPDGLERTVQVPLIDEAGLILSKAKSIASPKRHRDAFDIYLAMRQPSRDNTITKLTTACKRTNDLKTAVGFLQEYLETQSESFDRNVLRYTNGVELPHKASTYASEFLAAI
jgi:hypothetical protein